MLRIKPHESRWRCTLVKYSLFFYLIIPNQSISPSTLVRFNKKNIKLSALNKNHK